MTPQKTILADLIHFRASPREASDRMDELEELVRTYGGAVVVKSIQRKEKPEGRTFPIDRLHADLPSVRLQDFLADGKPQTASADLPGALVMDLAELPEKLRHVLGADPNTFVLNGNPNDVVESIGPEGDPLPFL